MLFLLACLHAYYCTPSQPSHLFRPPPISIANFTPALVPAILSLITVIILQFVMLSSTSCRDTSHSGCRYLLGTVACSYSEILIFSWVFMGTNVYLTLPGDRKYKVMRPFSSLKTVAVCHGLVLLISLAISVTGLLYVMEPRSTDNADDNLVFYTAVGVNIW